jgi:hypothetical protein
MEALLQGSIGLDRSLDYTGNLFLPAQFVSRRGGPLLLRQDEAGRVIVPFTVQGMANAPRVALDANALGGGTKGEVVDALRKRLGGKIEELMGQPPAQDQPGQESEKTGPEAGDQPSRQRRPGKILQDLFRR